MKPIKSLSLVALIASFMLAACGGGSGTSSSTTTLVSTITTEANPVVTGMLSLTSHDGIFEHEIEGTMYCTGTHGYDDIGGGANVVVYDGKGSIIGTGALDVGLPDDGGACDFDFSVPLSTTADFYTVDVAGRGGPTFSHDDMEQSGWSVGLSL